MKHDTYVAPASAVISAWVGLKTSVMLIGMPSLDSLRVASRPASQNGTLTTMCSCSVRSAWPSRIIPSTSRDTTSADVGPSTRSQICLIASPGSVCSLARSEGLVVAPDRMPHGAMR